VYRHSPVLPSERWWNARTCGIKADPKLAHVHIVHDPFHIMKRAGEAVTELRGATIFRAEGEMRAVGRGTRWW
jgi:hypothetical protein